LLEIPGVEPAFESERFHEWALRLPRPISEVNALCVERGIIGPYDFEPRLFRAAQHRAVCCTEKRSRARRSSTWRRSLAKFLSDLSTSSSTSFEQNGTKTRTCNDFLTQIAICRFPFRAAFVRGCRCRVLRATFFAPLDRTRAPLPIDAACGAVDLARMDEHSVVRHFSRLSQLNYSIDTHFYPLGSCTMKYNPRLNEAVAALPGFASVHLCRTRRSARAGCKYFSKRSKCWRRSPACTRPAFSPWRARRASFAAS
jgi:hypothetical protein